MLQLAQMLDRVAPGRARLVIVGEEEFAGVAELPDHELQRLMHGDDTRAGGEVAAARALWAAFRAPEPPRCPRWRTAPSSAPRPTASCSSTPGAARLNRTERALLQAVADGAARPPRRSSRTSARRSGRSWATRSRSSTSPRSRAGALELDRPRAARC